MSDQRKAWTEFVEKREREQQAKRGKKPRTKKPETSPQEFEQALDDLVSEARDRSTNA